jgi:hypothetical protein
MRHPTSIVDGPKIEDDTVVLRVVVEHPELEDSGAVFVCRYRDFADLSVEAFPVGQTPQAEAEYRAEAVRAAQVYVDAHLGEMEELFEELARRTS